jgi:hypothetical protein
MRIFRVVVESRGKGNPHYVSINPTAYNRDSRRLCASEVTFNSKQAHIERSNSVTNLPPELELFSSLMDAQREPVRAALHYCLSLVMVESGNARLIETRPGDASPICVFETVAGDTFSLAKPAISQKPSTT